MKRILALAFMIAALCGAAMSQQAAEFSSYYSGNRYDFRLTHKQLLNTPAWPEDAPNPPLSPRSAQSAAMSYLSTLFDNATGWRLSEIKLVPVNERWVSNERWVYVVSYVPPPQNCADCWAAPFGIVVTMDGKAVAAVVSPWDPTQPPVNE